MRWPPSANKQKNDDISEIIKLNQEAGGFPPPTNRVVGAGGEPLRNDFLLKPDYEVAPETGNYLLRAAARYQLVNIRKCQTDKGLENALLSHLVWDF